jgi:lipoate-protein ligase B
VNTGLEPFSWVNPCGLKGVRMASMKEIIGKEIPMEDVHGATVTHIQEIFGVQLKQKTLNDIPNLLHSDNSAHDRKAI